MKPSNVNAVALACVGCKEVAQGALDELRGAPTAKQLSQTSRFERGPIWFDYPAIFRAKTDFDGGSTFPVRFTFREAEIEVIEADFDADLDEWLLSGADSLGGAPNGGLERIEARSICGSLREGKRAEVSVLGSR